MIAANTLLQNRYLVLNQIGQGGMGAVYMATDQRFGSTVALKETFFNDSAMRKAFEREARLLNHLRHPALPRVSDHFTEEEGQFLVMEYIAGDDLAEKLKERGSAFPFNEVLNWADQLLDALDYLHTQEPIITHRDIKPQNLKLTPRNAIVLLDFGLAKGTPAVQVSKMTATGSVFGYSRFYAPLEQIQGAGTDPRSDLYSLGATLYHLITGVIPPDALTRATAVLNGQPDPLSPANEVHEQVTPPVAQVINDAMAQNASQRPQTASAMREMLREAARLGHSIARETNAQPPPSTNLYEQETQLIYGAAISPATATGEAANKTGGIKADEATAAGSATSTGGASSSSTNAADPDSVVTKVASVQPTAQKSRERRRVIGIAASAAVLVALAAVVYTFTRNSEQKPPGIENIQSTPAAPQTSNTDNQTDNHNGQQPGETVIVIKKGGSPETNAVPTPTSRHADTPQDKPAKIAPLPVPVPRDEAGPIRVNPPEPPNPDPMADPIRRGRLRPRPGDPNFEEVMRAAEERRRAADEERRAAQERRRLILMQQRIMLENMRRRRKQLQQP
jgi:serine/threonine protein kinase